LHCVVSRRDQPEKTREQPLPKKHETLLLAELKPSKRLKQLLIIIHVLTLASTLANALPVAVKLAILTGICLNFLFVINNLKGERYTIKHTEALGWEIADGNGFESIQVLNSTVITVFAIFLHFNKNAHKQSVLIMNDALSEDDYRRLVVRLKTAEKK
jgi:toxin CptA